MLQHPQIDPVAISLGPLKVHWYGLTYLVGFLAGWWLGRLRARKPWSPITEVQMGDLLFYLALGVILGGRFGYVVFYNFDVFLADPLWLFRVWEGGMAFHGGLLGVINGELWGKPTDVAWGMVFRTAPDSLARHPSQLYQFALEGIALFVILWWFSAKPRPRMAVSGLFLLTYGIFRFLVEFVRQPDPQLGYLAFDWLTMGQVLSFPMILAGAALMFIAYRRNPE